MDGIKYRTKPVVVEVIKCSLALHFAQTSWNSLPCWLAGAYERGEIMFLDGRIQIITNGRQVSADLDDMIICSANMDISVCGSEIFAAHYEKV